MKRVLILLPAILVLWVGHAVFAAYPREYPIYLGLMGFEKSEIEHLRGGGMVKHSIPNKLPGEYGILAARVFNVPVYYFRDYYRYIENYRTLFRFEEVGKFKPEPDARDLLPLVFSDSELEELASCKVGKCGLKLSEDEIGMIPDPPDLKTPAGRDSLREVYHRVLLDRLNSYRHAGLAGLGKYSDGTTEDDPQEIFKTHLLRFNHVEAYFPGIYRYLVEYPSYKDKRIEEFFYWTREHQGNKPVISIRHVITRRVGEDYLIINRLVYGNHYYLSSMAVMHLINYADAISPWTLFVFEQRTVTDLNGPFEGIGRNILRANLERNVASDFKAIGEEMELRYKSRPFANFPFGILPRDQR